MHQLHQQMQRIFTRTLASSVRFHSPRVAVVGSGPAGLYACSRLLDKIPSCSLDVFDRNQVRLLMPSRPGGVFASLISHPASKVPYGLVYYGVAPDHPDMKKCANQFERMFDEHTDRLSLFCDVTIGSELSYEELCDSYEAVILAYGATKARRLNLPNEDAINCLSGMEFVSWYNGCPTKCPLLDTRDAVIIGNGNVAIDCARILQRSAAQLSITDVPEYALSSLRRSAVRTVKIFGRRGPNEASFTIKELRELLNLHGCSNSCVIPGERLAEMEEERRNTKSRARKRILELMLERRAPRSPGYERSCFIEFWHTPTAINVNVDGRVESVEFLNRHTNEAVRVPCGLLISAIGFENFLLKGLPETEEGKLKMLDWCRVPNDKASVYATGVARGVIAESQDQAHAVVDEMMADWEHGRIKRKPRAKGAGPLLEARGIPYTTWADWKYIDECERRAGAALGKPREKLLDYRALLQAREAKDE